MSEALESSDSYLFLIACQTGADKQLESGLVKQLSSFGRVAATLPGVWLLAVDIEEVEDNDVHAGFVLESLLENLDQELQISVVEVSNIATYNVADATEELLDQLFPQEDEDDYEGEEE